MLHASAVLSTTGLGGLYFISAPAAGIALGLGWPMSALLAWVGYSAAGIIVSSLGSPARAFLIRKMNLDPAGPKDRFLWRCWERTGLLGLILISPVTIGPKGAALVGLAMGERPLRLMLSISLGALPWALGLALATNWGISLIH